MNEAIMIIASVLPSLGAVVGVYVSVTRDVEKLKGRVYSLESDRDEVKLLVKECIDGIHELKVLLAKKGL
jgi:hypothetical protein